MADRVRSTVTGGFTTPHTTKVYSRSGGSTWTHAGDLSPTYSGTRVTKYIQDVVTPGFNSIVKCGGFLPLHGVVISTTTETHVAGTGEFLTSWDGSAYATKYVFDEVSSVINDYSVDVPAINESLVDSLVTSAVARLHEAIMDMLTTLAELRELVELFKSSVNRLRALAIFVARQAKYWSNRRRGWRPRGRNSRRLYDPFEIFAGLWLEYRYGWLPLVYGLQDALRALESSVEKGDLLKGIASASSALSDSLVTTGGSPTDGVYTWTSTLSGSRKYTVKAYGKVSDPNRAKFAFDPLITAWELVPFSFVVDWFLGVGDFIQSWSPFSGANFLGITASTVTDYTLVNEHDQVYPGVAPYASGSYTGALYRKEEKRYDRWKPSIPLLPTWNPSLNTVRQLDLAALVYSLKRDVQRILVN